jgi:hypothetical protein
MKVKGEACPSISAVTSECKILVGKSEEKILLERHRVLLK